MARKPVATDAFQIGRRVTAQVAAQPYARHRNDPVSRGLQIYTLDPSVSGREGGVATVAVPWEPLEPGPKAALFEFDGAGAPEPLAAPPLDLDDPKLLLAGGLTPSPANGQFHLQMTYAVCSLTYAAFRQALGRDIGWAFAPRNDGRTRLRVRPFAFEGRNAGYSREAGDLAFGYFRADSRPAGFTIPHGLVFTALSHDVVAHETTHALLDGLRSSFQEPTNVDVPAFHEAFADLVALFLHFTYPGVVDRALRRSRGVVEQGSLLADIAREFGYARAPEGKPSALRSGVDVAGIQAFDSDAAPGGPLEPRKYDPRLDPHELGAVLVSAVFEAFVTIVRRKSERLFRIADLDPTRFGTVPLPDPLLEAVARETCDVARQFLAMCIRAIDYCPPVDLLFGEYLRALVTADRELEPTDSWGYREALMRSCRRRMIFPEDVQFMTEDAVRWGTPEGRFSIPGLAFHDLKFDGEPGRPAGEQELLRQARALGNFVSQPAHAAAFRLVPPGPLPAGVEQAAPPIVESIRVARRVTPDGRILFDTIAEVVQPCVVRHGADLADIVGGCTIVIDPQGLVRYAIAKGVASPARRERQFQAMAGPLRHLWRRRRQGRGRRFSACGDMLMLLHGGAHCRLPTAPAAEPPRPARKPRSRKL